MNIIRPIAYSKALNRANTAESMSRKWYGLLSYVHYFVRYVKWKRHLVFTGTVPLDYSQIKEGSIPILLNNFNRLEPLRELVSWLQSLETPVSVIILDNKSTFPPLLEYYASLKNSPVQVIMMGFNSGRFGLMHYFKKLRKYDKVVISDCDLVPYADTPRDTLLHLSALLDKYPEYNHVGVSLEIRDIPDTYPLKPLVLAWEKKFWPPIAKEVNNEAYAANVDTTFSMWRTNATLSPLTPALRTKAPYRLKHLDWYLNPHAINPEYKHYMGTCSSFGSWTRELVRWKTEVPPLSDNNWLADHQELPAAVLTAQES